MSFSLFMKFKIISVENANKFILHYEGKERLYGSEGGEDFYRETPFPGHGGVLAFMDRKQ